MIKAKEIKIKKRNNIIIFIYILFLVISINTLSVIKINNKIKFSSFKKY